MKKVSVIILNWNGSKLLHEYLPSVVKHSNKELADIIVADNGSTDDSLEVLAKAFPDVRVLPFKENYGFSRGYNLAISYVDTDCCILLNDDVRVTECWIEPMYEYMESHRDVGAIQPKILSDRDNSMFEYAGAAGGYLDKHGYPYCRGRIFDHIEKDIHQYDDVTDIMWASGACIMVRTKIFYQAGSLDEYLFAHMEEIDLCWRMRNLGYKIVYLPTSTVYHYGGASLAMGNPLKTRLNFRNSIIMLHKNLPNNVRGGVIKRRLLLDGLAAINFLLRGQFRNVGAIWKAHCEAFKIIRLIYSSPQKPQPKPESTERRESKISIIFNYYFQRRRTFTQIFQS